MVGACQMGVQDQANVGPTPVSSSFSSQSHRIRKKWHSSDCWDHRIGVGSVHVHRNPSPSKEFYNSTSSHYSLLRSNRSKEPNLGAKIKSMPWTSKFSAGALHGEIRTQISPIVAFLTDILLDPPRRRRSRAEGLRTRFLARTNDLKNPSSSSISGSSCIHGRSRDASLDRMELDKKNIWRRLELREEFQAGIRLSIRELRARN